MISPPEVVDELCKQIETKMAMKWKKLMDASEWKRYLGREWQRREDPDRVVVRVPPQYFEQVLDQHGLGHCKPVVTPGEADQPDDTSELTEAQHRRFRSTVGCLMWTIAERPDIADAVRSLARQAAHPTEARWARLKRLLRYLRGAPTLELELKTNDMEHDKQFVEHGEKDDIETAEILGYADAAWAAGPDRRSGSGGVVFLQGLLLETFSKTHVTVAQSTCEAELVAMNAVTREMKAVTALCAEIGLKTRSRLLSDSSSAVPVTTRVGPGRVRHIETRRFWLQQEVEAHRLSVAHVKGEDNFADALTKQLPRARHQQLTWILGVRGESHGVGE